MKKISLAILLSFLFTFSFSIAQGQIFKSIFHKKPSKKELSLEIDILNQTIDSLKQELEFGSIPIIDTVTVNDSINPGGLNFFDSEDFIDPSVSTDSLLSIWYLHNNLSMDDNGSIIDLDTEMLTSDTPDSVFIARLKAINSFIPLPYNNIVKNHIIYYTQKIPNKIDLIIGLSNYYLPQIEEILDEYDLPKELKVMAIIESALNPRAVSRANAKGMWQFMYRTALQYNLKIDSYIDERLDPIASAHAAAKYMKDSYTIFGDWLLAIASYNCGPGNVNKAIRRAGSKEFWAVYPFLPRETRGYVPSFVAALYTINYYKEHRITPRAIEMPAHVDTFIIKKPLHFGQISELMGISKEEISNNNPQYLREIIPGSTKGNILRLPYNYTNAFIDKEKDIYSYKDSIYFNPIIYNETKASSSSNRSSSITHKVKSGETLSHIALKYRVRVSDIQAWNGVRSIIRPGQRLIIYTSNPPVSSSSHVKTSTSGGYVIYTIKKGDTLWDISRKFNGVSLNQIMRLNGFTKKSKIMPGKKIKIKPV